MYTLKNKKLFAILFALGLSCTGFVMGMDETVDETVLEKTEDVPHKSYSDKNFDYLQDEVKEVVNKAKNNIIKRIDPQTDKLNQLLYKPNPGIQTDYNSLKRIGAEISKIVIRDGKNQIEQAIIGGGVKAALKNTKLDKTGKIKGAIIYDRELFAEAIAAASVSLPTNISQGSYNQIMYDAARGYFGEQTRRIAHGLIAKGKQKGRSIRSNLKAKDYYKDDAKWYNRVYGVAARKGVAIAETIDSAATKVYNVIPETPRRMLERWAGQKAVTVVATSANSAYDALKDTQSNSGRTGNIRRIS